MWTKTIFWNINPLNRRGNYTQKAFESTGGGESLTLRKEKGRFVCLSLLKQANRSFFFEQGASGSLLGLRRNPSLSAMRRARIIFIFAHACAVSDFNVMEKDDCFAGPIIPETTEKDA